MLALIGGVVGAIVGSFLGAVLVRWPRGEQAVAGRSRCDGCGVALGPLELVPVLSYLARRGRCRACGARIDPRHLAMEVGGMVVGLVAFLGHPLPLAGASALLGWWLLLIAALDLEHHWLPDKLTLPLLLVGLLAGRLGLGPPLVERMLGVVIGFAVLALIALIYRHARGREGLGGGDPKLLAALGAWLGALSLPLVLLGAGLVGIGAVIAMAARGRSINAATRLPLGTLMALAAWPIWLAIAPTYVGGHSGPVHLWPL